MASLRTLLLTGAAIAASAASASAADLYGGGMKDGYAAMSVPELRPSLYVRVDGGYGAFDNPTITEDHLYDLTSTSIDNTWSVGGGIGAYFGRGFRGDITVERIFEADVAGDLPSHPKISGWRNFGLSSTVALANVYYDFNTGGRFTPYIGAGLGFAHNETSAGTVTTCGCTTATIGGDSENHVAAAAMAGLSWKLRGGQSVVSSGGMKDAPMVVDSGRGLYLDVGYRFLYLGEAITGPVTAISSGSTVVSQDPTVEDIHEHQFRFGLRYDFR